MGVVAPMTYLGLVQRLQSESGTSGSAVTTLVGVTGEALRLKNWIAQAYVEIQALHHDWLWLMQDVQFDTIANQQSYSPTTTTFTTPAGVGIADFARWKIDPLAGESSFRLWLASSGSDNETWLHEVDYVAFRDYYLFGRRRVTYARPISISVDPQQNLLLGLGPNDVYTVVGKYFQAPQFLSADADVPAMPARFHMLIVYWALEHYSFYEAAPEVIAGATKFGKRMLRELEAAQLPSLIGFDPLV